LTRVSQQQNVADFIESQCQQKLHGLFRRYLSWSIWRNKWHGAKV